MPTQGVQYRAPYIIPDESLLDMVMTEPRPPRPNSIELRRSYPPEEQHLYSPPSSDHYRFVILSFGNGRDAVERGETKIDKIIFLGKIGQRITRLRDTRTVCMDRITGRVKDKREARRTRVPVVRAPQVGVADRDPRNHRPLLRATLLAIQLLP